MIFELMSTAAEAAKSVAAAPEAAQFTKQHLEYLFKALTLTGAFCAMGFAAIGSAYGAGISCSAAIGAWKKCYAQNKPAPFQLLVFGGAPLSQVIYGMIIMFVIMGNTNTTLYAAWSVYLFVGILAGIAMGFSAYWQGRAGAAACDAFAETGKGFTNQLMALGIVETVAIFIMAFVIVLLGNVQIPA